ncbi:MAG TPA: hypothetical protein VL026_09605 [Rhizomicrobium sp.]|nr:hypothetical protein [Rhizomicrobium sp.]
MQTNAPHSKTLRNGTEVIAASSYPPVLPQEEIGAFIARLKSEDAQISAKEVMASSRATIRTAVDGYVRLLDDAARQDDVAAIFAQAHELRGLGELAGIGVVGRMANGLCQYLDALDGKAPDSATVRLHVEAIERVVRGQDHGAIAAVVAEELTALVIRKLGEAHALGLPG